uniref:AT rich interactive domain 2 (ARID, RFX-like) n=1 Tax=Petromyzon marinus TaxID=7757 RepID=S4RV91_PETMA
NADFCFVFFHFRYLETYEKVHHFGEEDDEFQGSSRPQTPVGGISYTYNYQQHNVPDHMRQGNGLSTELLPASEYRKLALSLLSGLPNEVDFAVNVCTLLSHEGRRAMHLDRDPRLVALLLAHAGVFDDSPGSLFNVYDSEWRAKSGRDFIKFWKQSIDDLEVRELICDKNKVYQGRTEQRPWGEWLLSTGRSAGVDDPECQRVLQISVILRNLSFLESNAKLMASHRACLRFLIMCAHCKFSSLRQMGLDTLGNIASELQLDPIDFRSTQLIFHTITKCLTSTDKFQRIRGMEILGSLCMAEENGEVVGECVEVEAYCEMVQLLVLPDVLLVLGTLEVLYQLSEIGEGPCSKIARVHRSVECLVSLATLDVQTMGTECLSVVKIVEHHTPAPHVPADSRKQAVEHARTEGRASRADKTSRGSLSTSALGTTEVDGETFACQWMNSHFEASSDSSISRTDMYSEYLSTCSKLARSSILTSTAFSKGLKTIFPGLSYKRIEDPLNPGHVQYHIVGVRRRPSPLPAHAAFAPHRPGTPNRAGGLNPGDATAAPAALPCPGSAPGGTAPSPGPSRPLLQQAQTPPIRSHRRRLACAANVTQSSGFPVLNSSTSPATVVVTTPGVQPAGALVTTQVQPGATPAGSPVVVGGGGCSAGAIPVGQPMLQMTQPPSAITACHIPVIQSAAQPSGAVANHVQVPQTMDVSVQNSVARFQVVSQHQQQQPLNQQQQQQALPTQGGSTVAAAVGPVAVATAATSQQEPVMLSAAPHQQQHHALASAPTVIQSPTRHTFQNIAPKPASGTPTPAPSLQSPQQVHVIVGQQGGTCVAPGGPQHVPAVHQIVLAGQPHQRQLAPTPHGSGGGIGSMAGVQPQTSACVTPQVVGIPSGVPTLNQMLTIRCQHQQQQQQQQQPIQPAVSGAVAQQQATPMQDSTSPLVKQLLLPRRNAVTPTGKMILTVPQTAQTLPRPASPQVVYQVTSGPGAGGLVTAQGAQAHPFLVGQSSFQVIHHTSQSGIQTLPISHMQLVPGPIISSGASQVAITMMPSTGFAASSAGNSSVISATPATHNHGMPMPRVEQHQLAAHWGGQPDAVLSLPPPAGAAVVAPELKAEALGTPMGCDDSKNSPTRPPDSPSRPAANGEEYARNFSALPNGRNNKVEVPLSPPCPGNTTCEQQQQQQQQINPVNLNSTGILDSTQDLKSELLKQQQRPLVNGDSDMTKGEETHIPNSIHNHKATPVQNHMGNGELSDERDSKPQCLPSTNGPTSALCSGCDAPSPTAPPAVSHNGTAPGSPKPQAPHGSARSEQCPAAPPTATATPAPTTNPSPTPMLTTTVSHDAQTAASPAAVQAVAPKDGDCKRPPLKRPHDGSDALLATAVPNKVGVRIVSAGESLTRTAACAPAEMVQQQQQQQATQQVMQIPPAAVPATPPTPPPAPPSLELTRKPNQHFMCLWKGCRRYVGALQSLVCHKNKSHGFMESANARHVYTSRCNECDRYQFAFVNPFQDKHCTKEALQAGLQKLEEKIQSEKQQQQQPS